MSSREDLKNFQLQLDQVNDGLSITPDDQELLDLKAELTDLIDLLREQLKTEEAEQEAKNRKWQQQHPKKPISHTPSRTDSPITSNGEDTGESPEPASIKPEQQSFKIGDVVTAKWASGDGGYYPAKITQITGSSAHPFYTVQFLKYQTMETLPAYSIKVLADDKKRKVTAAGFDKPKPPPKKIDPQAREAAEDKKKRRLLEKQELEKTKQSWQKFATTGPRKRVGAVGRSVPIGSNSMFKTPESVEGRGIPPFVKRC